MKKLLALAGLLCIVGAVPADADPTPMPLDQIGVGPNGYDFMLGFWKCANTRYSSPGVTFNRYIRVTRSHLSGSIVLDWESGDGHVVLPWSYDEKSRTWSEHYIEDQTSDLPIEAPIRPNPMMPRYFEESTTDTGPKSVWTGSSALAQFGHTPIRETWTFTNLSELDDLTEVKVKDSWTAIDDDHCMKSD